MFGVHDLFITYIENILTLTRILLLIYGGDPHDDQAANQVKVPRHKKLLVLLIAYDISIMKSGRTLKIVFNNLLVESVKKLDFTS